MHIASQLAFCKSASHIAHGDIFTPHLTYLPTFPHLSVCVQPIVPKDTQYDEVEPEEEGK